MTTPEQAGGVAAESARLRREAGGYANVGSGGELDATIVSGQPSRELLAQWAVIEIEPDEILYSTRSAGAPITWVKQLLVRLLRQYFVELEARQTRFNIALLERLDALEGRAGHDAGEAEADVVRRAPHREDAGGAEADVVRRAPHREDP